MKSIIKSHPAEIHIDKLYVDISLCSAVKNINFVIESYTHQIGKTKYWYRIDNPFGAPRPGNLKHMHGFIGKKGNLKDVFAMNSDGTAHDGCHNTHIPQDFIPYLKQNGFVLPSNNIIEMIVVPSNSRILLKENNQYLKCEGITYEKTELNNAIHEVCRLIKYSNIHAFGITNYALNHIYNEYHHNENINMNIIYLSQRYENAKWLCGCFNEIVNEITGRCINLEENIDYDIENAAYVVYAIYN